MIIFQKHYTQIGDQDVVHHVKDAAHTVHQEVGLPQVWLGLLRLLHEGQPHPATGQAGLQAEEGLPYLPGQGDGSATVVAFT